MHEDDIEKISVKIKDEIIEEFDEFETNLSDDTIDNLSESIGKKFNDTITIDALEITADTETVDLIPLLEKLDNIITILDDLFLYSYYVFTIILPLIIVVVFFWWILKQFST